LVLAIASKVFEVIFAGNFKESKLGRDNAIELDDVTPEAFDCAMR
jgi:BTB/POZ domain